MAMGAVPTLNRTVQYTFEIVDNVLDTCHLGADAQKKFDGAIKQTTNSITDQNISYIKAVAAMGAFRHGVHSLAMGFQELGFISKENNKTFYDMIAVIDIVVGAAMAFKGVVGIMNMLRDAEIGVALVETYRKILANPGWAAVAIGAGIAAVGVAGYLASIQPKTQSEAYFGAPAQSQVNQNVYFTGGGTNTDARHAARSSLEGMGF